MSRPATRSDRARVLSRAAASVCGYHRYGKKARCVGGVIEQLEQRRLLTITFNNAVQFDVGNNPNSVATADFNGDGRDDLAVGNTNDDNVSVLLSAAAGGFESPVNYAVGNAPFDVVTDDFNGDGEVDLAVANFLGGSVSILLGNGNGTFAAASPVPLGAAPTSIAVTDFNVDGFRDLVTGNYANNNVSVLLGDGSGSFSTTNFPAGGGPADVAVADRNGDGYLDILLSNFIELLGDGTGNFSAPLYIVNGGGSDSIATADFDGNQYADVVRAGFSQDYLQVTTGYGSGEVGTTVVGYDDGPIDVLVADLDADGLSEILVANFYDDNVHIYVQLADNQPKLSFGVGPVAVALGDFNGDGALDIVTANASTNKVTVRLNLAIVIKVEPPVQFEPPVTVRHDFRTQFVATGDFNSDGTLDILTANSVSDSVSLVYGDGAGNLSLPTTYFVGDGPASVASGDFNGDGNIDLATANLDGDNVSILLSAGDGQFFPPAYIPTGDGPRSIVADDFSGDGKVDLAVLNGESATVSLLIGRGTGQFFAPIVYSASPLSQPHSLVAADINGDGRPDLAIGKKFSGVSLLLNDGVGAFAPPVIVGPGGQAIAIADFNGDGKLDIVTTSIGGSAILVALGDNGQGTFLPSISYPSGSSNLGNTPVGVAVGDFNGDGNLDLGVAMSNSSRVVMLGNGQGAFAQPSYPTGPTNPSAVASGDFNADGRTDLVIASGFGFDGAISVLLNALPPLPPPPPAIPSLSIADASIAEGTGTGNTALNFTITRTGSLLAASDVYVATATGTASAPGDFTAITTPTLVHFNAGQGAATITVQIKKDSLQEPSETFLVNLTSPTGGTISDAQAVGTIIDDEPRLTATGRNDLKADKKRQFTGVVASFTSADFNSASSFASLIDWGDGTTGAGSIVWNATTSKWDIYGTHLYARKARFVMTITITDANGVSATVNSLITA